MPQSNRPDATRSKSALGTAVRRATGVAMADRCPKRVVMRTSPEELMDSTDAEILGVVSVAGQCRQIWSAGVDVLADPGEKIGVVGSVRGDAVSFRGASGVTSKKKMNMRKQRN